MPGVVGHPQRWRILAILVLSLLIMVMDSTILNVTLKTLADPRVGLGATQAELEWMVNSYTLVFGGLIFTWGVLADRWGRRKVLLLGLAIFGAFSLGAAFATTPLQLIGARTIMGIGGSALMPATLATLSEVFDNEERPKAFGIWAASVGMALAAGPVLGGFLLDHFDWGAVFLVNVPIAVLAIVGIVAVVPETRNPNPGAFDPLGVALSIVGLTLMVYGIIIGGEEGFGLVRSWGCILLGAAVLGVMVVVEARMAQPSLDVSLFADARFSAAVALLTVVFFALMGMSFSLSFYMQSVRGLSAFDTGLTLVPLALLQLAAAPRSPQLVQRFGVKAVCATGSAIVALSLGGLSLISVSTPLWLVIADTAALGLGMGIISPPATTSIMAAVPRAKAGAGSAVSQAARQIGATFGVAIIGSVLSAGYRAAIDPTLAQIPVLTAAQREAIGGSIEATLGFVEKAAPMFPQARLLIDPAKAAYVHAAATATDISVVFACAGIVVALLWLPGRRVHAYSPAE